MNKPIGKVYFVKAGEFVKIGVTEGISLKERLSAIQTGNPIKLELLGIMLGGYEIEKKLHSKFTLYRVEREWFNYSNEIKEFIVNFAVTDKEEIENLEKKEIDFFEATVQLKNHNDDINKLQKRIDKLVRTIENAIYGLVHTYYHYTKYIDEMDHRYELVKNTSYYYPSSFVDTEKPIKEEVQSTMCFRDGCSEIKSNIRKYFIYLMESFIPNRRFALKFLGECMDIDNNEKVDEEIFKYFEWTLDNQHLL